jgi:sterol desaturase/sphingolipid hydroxylase (fatty acid hydroxylase superfamily)
MNPEQLSNIRLILFLSILPIMLLLESFRPARPWHDSRLKRLGFHFSFSVFNSVIYRLVAAAPLLALTMAVHDRGWGLSAWLGLTGPAEWAATFVVMDFFDYWWHRINHVIPFLWRFHRGHHYDTHVDVSTSLRFHTGELLLSGLMKSTWILLWGPSAVAFAIFESGITAFAQFHHANIDFPDPIEKALRWVHMTPRLHAAHHTVTFRSRDANYSTIFLIWDYMFGTFQEADYKELEQLGIKEGRDRDLSFWALLKSPISLK